MKSMKKYTQSFATTKQLTKEKLGKAENSTDSQETRELKEKLHMLKWSLKSLKCMGEEYVTLQNKEAEKGSEMGDVMKSSGTGFLSGTEVGNALLATGELMGDISGNVKASGATANSQLVIPVDRLYREDVKPVLEIKSRQEMARLKYEAAFAKVKDLQKKQNAKQLSVAEDECRIAKQTHADLTAELHKAAEGLMESIGRTLLPQLVTLASFQASFYANAAERWKQVEQQLSSAEAGLGTA